MSGQPMKATMFASLKNGGHLQVWELVNFPGIVVTKRQETRKHIWTQTVTLNLTEFENIELAIQAWKHQQRPGPLAEP